MTHNKVRPVPHGNLAPCPTANSHEKRHPREIYASGGGLLVVPLRTVRGQDYIHYLQTTLVDGDRNKCFSLSLKSFLIDEYFVFFVLFYSSTAFCPI